MRDSLRPSEQFVPVPADWRDGTAVWIHAFECVGCGVLQARQRDFDRDRKEAKDIPRGEFAPGDGLRFVATPHSGEEVDRGRTP